MTAGRGHPLVLACLALCLLPAPALQAGRDTDSEALLPQPFDTGASYVRDVHVDASAAPDGDGTAGKPFQSIARALAGAGPGTRIRIAPGRYGAIGTVSGLHGTPERPVALVGDGGAVIDSGGSGVALRLVDPRYVVIEGLVIEGTVPHGINIDDGATYESPASHVVLRNLTFRNIGNGGNNDCLKMSGVDNFYIERSRFSGCNRGEAIDMVGCHHGVITGNAFGATPGIAVQTKGGSSDVLIHGNRFSDVTERAVNAGGSTGEPYFRPLDARHEAARIRVIANVIERTGGTPIAFSGCLQCVFANNTIVDPGRHALRIIEENRAREPGTGGYFINNVVVFRSLPGRFLVDVGPGADPQGFSIGSNLWYVTDDPQGPLPALFAGRPVAGDSVTGSDPLLDTDGRPLPGSAARRRARPVPPGILVDFAGRPLGPVPNFGAFAMDAGAAAPAP